MKVPRSYLGASHVGLPSCFLQTSFKLPRARKFEKMLGKCWENGAEIRAKLGEKVLVENYCSTSSVLLYCVGRAKRREAKRGNGNEVECV